MLKRQEQSRGTEPGRRGMKDCWGKFDHIMRVAKLIVSRAGQTAQKRICANAGDEHAFHWSLRMWPETETMAGRTAKLGRSRGSQGEACKSTSRDCGGAQVLQMTEGPGMRKHAF